MLGFDDSVEDRGSFSQFLVRLFVVSVAMMAVYYFGYSKFNKVVEQVNATQREQIALCEAMYEVPDKKEEPELGRVTGVLYSTQNPSVVIDGEILGIGEQIHGVTVAAVNQDSVELTKGQIRWNQKVQEDPPDHWKKEETIQEDTEKAEN
ncbi:MAG: hypothetical protein JXA82_04380 [Sedimentisphaerales bacterium]|nr:hypothetical protein [Sedimentisphaerales bacterium]